MGIYEYGEPNAKNVLLQPVGDHDLPAIENEIREIKRLTAQPFRLIAVKVERWNDDLSPWCAPAVFGHEDFGDGAAALLREILPLCEDADRRYIIGGYSMAGLFALWSAYRTERFSGIAAASPSLWFPKFLEYMQAHDLHSAAVYLSLGNREEKTRNPVMAAVGDRMRAAYALLQEKNVSCTTGMEQRRAFSAAGLPHGKGVCMGTGTLILLRYNLCLRSLSNSCIIINKCYRLDTAGNESTLERE